jgi:hypothetical protein
MGNPFLLQACLRLKNSDIPNPLEIAKKYKFTKDGHRLYQIKVPMDLRDENWNALGRCVITEYTVGNNKTYGVYVVVKIFNEEEKKHITNSFVSDEKVAEVLEKTN